ARANAATGAVYGLDGLMASYLSHPSACYMDKNGNIYIGGTYQGTMSFGSSNISSLPNMYLSDQFLVKYRNVPCNCNLLQPSFSFSSAAIGTFQFTYTGQ